MLQNAILPDIVRNMVQNFEKKLSKLYPCKSVQFRKILDDYTTDFDNVLILNLEYFETTKLLCEIDDKYFEILNKKISNYY